MAIKFLNKGTFSGDVAGTVLISQKTSIPIGNNSFIGRLSFNAYNVGTTYSTGANITATASSAWSNTSTGARLQFSTTSDTSVNPVNRMVIASNGYVGIDAGNDPGAKLHVNHFGASGNQTVVAALGSTSLRPVLQFSENHTSASITSGMSIEYNGVGSGDANHMAINSVTGAARFIITSGGSMQLPTYGAGTLVTDASGNITVSSGGGSGGPYVTLGTQQTITADKTFNASVLFNGTTFWRVSSADAALQRADARDDATSYARLHWYGQDASNATSNFRHAYYDGANYINVTAASGRLSFGGKVAGSTPTAAGDFATKAYADGLTPGAGVFLPLVGGILTGALTGTSATFSSNITSGSTTKTTSNVVRSLAADTVTAGFEAYGAAQGTGYAYVGQSASHGGGMFYNGDGTPAFATGETADRVSFYRRTNSANTVVFEYPHNSSTVTFKGPIIVGGTITGQNIYGNQFVDAQDNLYYANPAMTSVMKGATFDGDVTVTTQAVGNNSTLVATTAYADAAAAAVPVGNYLPLSGGTMANTNLVTNMNADLLDGKDHTAFGATLATYGTTAGASGRIRCTAPFNTNTGHMFQITVSIYSSYTIHNYVVGGYMYSSTNNWYSSQAVYSGTGSPDIIVGRDGNGKAYISIANGNYTGVRVHNMTRGYQTSVADTYDPWTISINGGTENSITPSISKTWNSGNDGAGSGLDADLLDGQQGSYYASAASLDDYVTLATAQTITGAKTIDTLKIGSANKIQFANNDFIRYEDATGVGRFHFDSDGGTNNSSVQAATFVGALSGNATTATTAADSNLLDGINSTQFLRSDANDTFTGTITGNTLHLGGSQITGSAAVLQVNGFQRTGNIYIHEGGNTPTVNGLPLGNNSGSLQWNSQTVYHTGNIPAYLPLAGGAMTGNIAMGNKQITGIDDLQFNSGVTIETSGTTNYLDVAYSSTGAGGIRLWDGDSTIQGYLYGDGGATSTFGLLHGSGSWAVKCLENGYAELYHNGSGKLITQSAGCLVTGVLTASQVGNSSSSTRDKLRVWVGSTYTIGMMPGYGYGGLGGNTTGTEYAMSFQMSNSVNRGWWWGDSGHTNLQGAMSLTTTGKAVIATSLSIGYGESTRTAATQALEVNGTVKANGIKLISGGTEYLNASSYSSSTYMYGYASGSTIYFGQPVGSWTQNIQVNGTATATNFILSSDKTLKNNIKEIDTNHIDVNWKNFELKSEPGVKRAGVIAQELEEKHPEFVRTDGKGIKSVAYIDLLITKIAELEARLEKLEK